MTTIKTELHPTYSVYLNTKAQTYFISKRKHIKDNTVIETWLTLQEAELRLNYYIEQGGA